MEVLVLWLLNKNKLFGDIFGGVVDDNPPANAGTMGSIPGAGKFYMPRSTLARVPQLLSPQTTATETLNLEPALCNEKLLQRSQCTAVSVVPALCSWRKPGCSNKDPVQYFI